MANRRLVIRDRVTAIIGVALLCVLVGASYYYSIQVELSGLKYVPSQSSPDFTARKITLTDFDDRGVATQRIAAETLDHFSDDRVRATEVRYYSLDAAKPQLTLTGERAWSKDGLETLELAGNVNIRRAPAANESDLHLRTDYLKAFLDTHQLETDKPVSMRRGTDTTTAQAGMIYNDITRQLQLNKQVVSVFQPRNAKGEPDKKANNQ